MARSLTVPAAEANRRFSKLLRSVKAGARVIITSHGAPVAELGPVSQTELEDAEQRRFEAAQARLEAHWATTETKIIGPWTRGELYED